MARLRRLEVTRYGTRRVGEQLERKNNVPYSSQRRWARTISLTLILIASAILGAAAGAVTSSPAAIESCLVDAINDERAAVGVRPAVPAAQMVPAVRDHSVWMSANGLGHMSAGTRAAILPSDAGDWAENVARGGLAGDCMVIHDAFMASAGHAANILGGHEFVAVGVYEVGAVVWVTQLFFDSASFSPQWDGWFWDDDGSIFEDDIDRLASKGISSGCGNDMYCPNDPMTRAQMAAFLVRALDLPPAPSAGFTDTVGTTFADDVNRLAAAGITNGCSSTRFCPSDPVTRGQMAAFLVRALELPPAGSAGFTDTAGSVFRKDIDRLAAAGITTGCGGTRYCPSSHVTRGQMAAFLVRALGL